MGLSSIYRFGEYELDGDQLRLFRSGQRVSIQSKPLALLAYLVRNSDRVVPREEILRAVWPGVAVEEGALKSAVYALRSVLAHGSGEPWIVNVHGTGYRFAGPLVLPDDPAQLRARDAAPRPAAPSTDFIEREREMERLRSACAVALRGDRQIVLLEGPPGIGKTRTATELAREAVALGFEVLVGRAHEGEGAPPLWPWTQVLRSWVASHGEASIEELGGAGQARRLLGLEAPRPAALPLDLEAAASDQARFRMFDQITRFLARATESHPLLLVLDDMHCVDSASLELLLFVTQHLGRARLLLVATHRPLAPGHKLARALRESGTRSMALACLSRASVEQILARTLGGRPPEPLVERVCAASGGNPLFVAELARTLGAESRSAAAQEAGSAPFVLASRLHDAVWTRLCECSEACKQVLSVASVCGPELTLPLLRRVLRGQLEDGALLAALEEAEQRDLLVSAAGLYRFVHGIVREVLYERLSRSERMQLHRRIGEALEENLGRDSAAQLEQRAYHFLACAPLGHAQRGVAYAQRAARAAREAFSYAEAVELYRRALDALAFLDIADPELRVSLLVELGDTLGQAAEPIQAFQSIFFEAIDQARQAGRVQLLARAAERCVSHTSFRGGFAILRTAEEDAAVERLRAALAEAAAAPELAQDPALLARVLLGLSLTLRARDAIEECELAIERALELAQSLSDARLRAHALFHQYVVVFDERLGRAAVPAELHVWVQRSEDLRLLVHAHVMDLAVALARGDRDRCESTAATIERMGSEIGLPLASYYAALWKWLEAQLDGPLDAARAQAVELLRIAAAANMSSAWSAITSGLQLWMLALLGGGAAETLVQTRDYAAQMTPRFPDLAFIVARLHAQCANLEPAREVLATAAKLGESRRSETWLLIAGTAADLCAFTDDRASAARLHAMLEPYADRVLGIGDHFICLGSVARPLGSLSALLGRWDESEAFFARAHAHAAALRAPVLRTWIDVEQTLAFQRHPAASERRRNTERRRTALAQARKLGLAGLIERLERS
jgi:eukaryotic-like serine/threonine-protein kinase